MARQVVADFRHWGFLVRTAVADTIGAAWAVTRTAAGPIVIPAGRQAQALSRLPVEALRISAEVAETLRSLGLWTIGHLAALPRETLPSRFGPEILRRLDQAWGHIPEPILPERPEELIEAASAAASRRSKAGRGDRTGSCSGCRARVMKRLQRATRAFCKWILNSSVLEAMNRRASRSALSVPVSIKSGSATCCDCSWNGCGSERPADTRATLRAYSNGAAVGGRPGSPVRGGRTPPRAPRSRFAPQPVEQSPGSAGRALSAAISRLSARTGRRVCDLGRTSFPIKEPRTKSAVSSWRLFAKTKRQKR